MQTCTLRHIYFRQASVKNMVYFHYCKELNVSQLLPDMSVTTVNGLAKPLEWCFKVLCH